MKVVQPRCVILLAEEKPSPLRYYRQAERGKERAEREIEGWSHKNGMSGGRQGEKEKVK